MNWTADKMSETKLLSAAPKPSVQHAVMAGRVWVDHKVYVLALRMKDVQLYDYRTTLMESGDLEQTAAFS